eukprot:7367136-Pyramimonas_sp.AAC.1
MSVRDLVPATVDVTLKDSVTKFVECMAAWSDTPKSLATFESLGPDLAARISAKDSAIAVKALLNDAALLLQKVGERPPCQGM